MNIVIIGSTQGLGLELVRKFLAEGHSVAAGFVDRKTPISLDELHQQYKGKLVLFNADVTNESEMIQGTVICTGFFGEVDALVNVAGVLLSGDRVNLIHQCDVSELRKTFEVNTFGAVIVGKSFYPVMKKGGMIFTVSSEGSGIKNCGTWVPCYALSKTAATKVSGMFNSAISDVDFYSVHPGRMNTEMGKTTAQIEPQDSANGFYKLITGEISISRDEWYINYLGEIMEV